MSIGAKAGVNIETCSMMYETFATVAAEMIGGARAEVKSAGKAVLEGRAKFEVTSSGEGEIKAPLLKIHSPLATIEGGKLTVKSALIQENGALFKKGVSMLDNLKVKGYTHLNGGLAVKKGAKIDGGVTVSKTFQVREGCKLKAELKVFGGAEIG